ncbi:MAG: filamentous hemagglutinin N-terminal domain-containing protein, partial [Cyanobacteriota bacterium]|nr:filamentous hemagglutinin N-terminal domain-containing protein [Cyanobacteriota bacterium]
MRKSIWAIAPSTLLALVPFPAFSQPILPANDGTQTIVTPEGDRFDIHGGQLSEDERNLFHSFEQFGLDEGQIANFISNPNIDNILGRVVGGDASYINGLIQVSGGDSNLFLINPAGIIFGEHASLNVTADFTATTATGIGFDGSGWLDIFGENNWASLIGDPNAFDFATANPGAIVNEGTLAVADRSNLRLLGGTIVNTGTLQSTDGNISVAAVPGENLVRLSAAGNILNLEVSPVSPTNSDPQFNPLSLPELLTGGTRNETDSEITVRPDGTLRIASSEAIVDPQAGDAIVSGKLIATGSQGQQTLQVLGDRIALLDATLDASGTNGGGNIFIGGDFQGNGTIPNAQYTFIDAGTTIFADALQQGEGGRVIVWADETTQFFGQISARGIDADGGFVEVSGKENLSFSGYVDVGTENGATGTLLLDPLNITISRDEPNDPLEVKETLPNIFAADFDGEEITVSAVTLEEQTADVILEATNNITIEDGVSLKFVPTAENSSITFRANADGIDGGDFIMDSTQSIAAAGRNVRIFGENITLGDIDVSNVAGNGGSIEISSATGSIFTGNLDASTAEGNGGAIDITSQTGAIVTGNLNSSGSTGGNITIDAEISITAGEIDSSGDVNNGGNVLLDPLGDIRVRFINAQGGASGIGGTVTIDTERFFVATDTFVDRNGIDASISTAGEFGGGPITISHGGGADEPFSVGPNFTGTNGTAGAIVSAFDNQILEGIFPDPEFVDGNITLRTEVPEPEPIPEPIPEPEPEPEPEPGPEPEPEPEPEPIPEPEPQPQPEPE